MSFKISEKQKMDMIQLRVYLNAVQKTVKIAIGIWHLFERAAKMSDSAGENGKLYGVSSQSGRNSA